MRPLDYPLESRMRACTGHGWRETIGCHRWYSRVSVCSGIPQGHLWLIVYEFCRDGQHRTVSLHSTEPEGHRERRLWQELALRLGEGKKVVEEQRDQVGRRRQAFILIITAFCALSHPWWLSISPLFYLEQDGRGCGHLFRSQLHRVPPSVVIDNPFNPPPPLYQ